MFHLILRLLAGTIYLETEFRPRKFQKGTIFSISTCEQCDIVIAHEDAKVNGRNGWAETTLKIDGIRGWEPCPAPVLTIVSNNTPFCTLSKIWSRRAQKGQIIELPEVETSETVAAIFVIEGMNFFDNILPKDNKFGRQIKSIYTMY